jgi:D-alanyl-D-alanine carboxypeptidase (penicillin-binding protein 5/6)
VTVALRFILAVGLCPAAFAGLTAPSAAAQEAPEVDRADAAIVVDVSDGAVMFREHARERRQIASTTKLMTALLALERARLGDVFTAPAYSALPQESKINLRRGERMQVEDLLEALLLESANDAAVTIAEGVSGSRRDFVEEMNDKAAELGLRDTSFANPIGLDDRENYSSAADLARLSVRLLRDRRFARIVDMPRAVLESGSRRRVVANRNKLVARYPFVDGIKTGHTLRAGYVLIGAGSGPGGARVVTVVLGEPGEAARDADTLALLHWGLGRFRQVRVLDRGRALARPKIEHFDRTAALVPRRSLTVTARKGQAVQRRVRAPEEIEGPLARGARIGSVMVLRGGKPVRKVDLVTARAVPSPGALRTLVSVLGVPLTILLVLVILSAVLFVVLRPRMRLRLVRER